MDPKDAERYLAAFYDISTSSGEILDRASIRLISSERYTGKTCTSSVSTFMVQAGASSCYRRGQEIGCGLVKVEDFHKVQAGVSSCFRRGQETGCGLVKVENFHKMQPYQRVNEPLADLHLAKEIIGMVKEAGCSKRCNVELGQHRVWACMDFGSANFLIFRHGVGEYMVDLILCAQRKMIPWVYIKDADFSDITGNPQVFVAAVNGDMDWDLPGMYYLMSELKDLPYSEEVLGRIEAAEQMEQASQ